MAVRSHLLVRKSFVIFDRKLFDVFTVSIYMSVRAGNHLTGNQITSDLTVRQSFDIILNSREVI